MLGDLIFNTFQRWKADQYNAVFDITDYVRYLVLMEAVHLKTACMICLVLLNRRGIAGSCEI